jgi:hypothetical protein
MAKELPYLPSYKNVETLFKKIATAKQPDAFTHQFLSEVVGLKSTADRPLITLLRSLGFLDSSGKPTPSYALLKNHTKARTAIANGVRTAYAGLFAANEKANELTSEEIKGLIAQVAGTDEGMTSKIAGTFNTLVKLGDFSAQASAELLTDKSAENETGAQADKQPAPPTIPLAGKGMRPDFHYNIQIHLPANATEETYLSIFNAIRKAFK